MATVYRAFDPSFDREVAIKVLPREFLHDPEFRQRFKREIKIIAALEHPAIVPVYDAGEEDGVPFFVMRYMPGGSLSNQISRGKFSMEDAAKIIERLSSALAYAHKKGIIHRDLKPDNILFDDNGNAYISDFGVASLVSSNTNLTGESAVGTPAYMSPEQAQGEKVDHRSDIYGLGVIIFQMLSGEQPYQASTPMGVALKQITDPVPEILKVNPELPRETDTVIKTAMAKKREDRYPSAAELARAFGQAANTGRHEAVHPTASSGTGFFGNQRNLILAGIGGLVVVVGIVAVAVVIGLFKGSAPGQPGLAEPVSAAESVTVTALPNDAAYFTEDFSGGLANWPQFVTAGAATDISVRPGDGGLLFDLSGSNDEAYVYYSPRSYDNVRIDLSVENASTSVANVYVVCRYDENKGWYQFNLESDGFYKIQYVSWNKNKNGSSSAIVADGATTKILTGKNVNQYSVSCNDRTLSLTVNGNKIREVVDNRFILSGGNIAVGVGSLKRGPVSVKIDPITIGQP